MRDDDAAPAAPAEEPPQPPQPPVTPCAASGPRLVLDLKQILSEVPDADEYDTRLTGQLEAVLADALPAFGACELTHFDGVEHGVVLSRVYAAASHAARNDSNTLYYALRTRRNSAALLTLQRIEALRGTCAEDSPLAMLFLMRDTQLILTNAQLRTLTKPNLCKLIRAMESATVRCPVCEDFLYEKSMTTLACGHTLHTDCYASLSVGSGPIGCLSCRDGDVSKPAVLENMTSEAFANQMHAVESTLSNLSVVEVEEVGPTEAADDDGGEDEQADLGADHAEGADADADADAGADDKSPHDAESITEE